MMIEIVVSAEKCRIVAGSVVSKDRHVIGGWCPLCEQTHSLSIYSNAYALKKRQFDSCP